jgi:hypothetical protein
MKLKKLDIFFHVAAPFGQIPLFRRTHLANRTRTIKSCVRLVYFMVFQCKSALDEADIHGTMIALIALMIEGCMFYLCSKEEHDLRYVVGKKTRVRLSVSS